MSTRQAQGRLVKVTLTHTHTCTHTHTHTYTPTNSPTLKVPGLLAPNKRLASPRHTYNGTSKEILTGLTGIRPISCRTILSPTAFHLAKTQANCTEDQSIFFNIRVPARGRTAVTGPHRWTWAWIVIIITERGLNPWTKVIDSKQQLHLFWWQHPSTSTAACKWPSVNVNINMALTYYCYCYSSFNHSCPS